MEPISKESVESNRQLLAKKFFEIRASNDIKQAIANLFKDEPDERQIPIMCVYFNRYEKIYIAVKQLLDNNRHDRFTWYERTMPLKKYIYHCHEDEDFKKPLTSKKPIMVMCSNYEIYNVLKQEDDGFFINPKTNETFMPEKEAILFITSILDLHFSATVTNFRC